MRLVLDTNRYTDLMGGVAEAAETVESAEEVFIPFAVLGELRAGFAGGSRRTANERILTMFLQRPFVRTLYADERTVAVYATLMSDLRHRGRVVPHNDVWIASLCVQHALALLTRDHHFDHLPQVMRV